MINPEDYLAGNNLLFEDMYSLIQWRLDVYPVFGAKYPSVGGSITGWCVRYTMYTNHEYAICYDGKVYAHDDESIAFNQAVTEVQSFVNDVPFWAVRAHIPTHKSSNVDVVQIFSVYDSLKQLGKRVISSIQEADTVG